MTSLYEEPSGGWYLLEPRESEPADTENSDPGDLPVLRASTATDTPMGFPVGKGHAGLRRSPTVVLGTPPVRNVEAELPGKRRPVVAVLDTVAGRELGVHPWLAPTDGETFLVEADWTPVEPNVPKPRGTGAAGPLDSHAGHGTFIAGLIRQVAPDAKVLMMRAMHASGEVYEHHLKDALTWLRDRVRAGRQGDFVDVICLALGYHEVKQPRDGKFTDELRQLLGELGNDGVRVVVAAGNDGSDRRTYPAALAMARNLPATALLSVGSYDPDGQTESAYSKDASWITHRDVGTAVVSTMPPFNGSGLTGNADATSGEVAVFDPDDFACGFARWSGTSFAAGIFAGRLAQALVTTGVLGNPDLDAHERARAALAAVAP